MAGDLLVQLINLGQFEAIRPTLEEIDGARVLNARSLEVVQRTFTQAVTATQHGRGLDALKRVLAQPDLNPRLFLTPRDVDAAVEAVLFTLCFEFGGDWGRDDYLGVSWAMIEHASGVMHDTQTLSDAFFAPQEADMLPYPARGEGALAVLRRSRLPIVMSCLQTLLCDPALKGRDELKSLDQLAQRAWARQGWSLGYTHLL